MSAKDSTKEKDPVSILDGDLGELSKKLQSKLKIESQHADEATTAVGSAILAKQEAMKKQELKNYLESNKGAVDKVVGALETKEELSDFNSRLNSGDVTVSELKLMERHHDQLEALKKKAPVQAPPQEAPENDKSPVGKSGEGQPNSLQALAEIDAITQNPNHPVYDPTHPDHLKATQEFNKLLNMTRPKQKKEATVPVPDEIARILGG